MTRRELGLNSNASVTSKDEETWKHRAFCGSFLGGCGFA
jgi:hypothetical protein